MSLNVDNAIWRPRRETCGVHYNNGNENEPTPMEIGNINTGPATEAQCEQRKTDLEKSTCSKRNKVECRPWKCRQPKINNVDIDPGNSTGKDNTGYLSESE